MAEHGHRVAGVAYLHNATEFGVTGLREIERAGHGLLFTEERRGAFLGHQPPRVRREVFRLAARASGLLGYMAVNTSDHALSEAYCTEARDLSREVGDLDTDLWACGTPSFSVYYADLYEESDACAAAAVEQVRRHAQSIRLLANGPARALGKRGDRRASVLPRGAAELPGVLRSLLFRPVAAYERRVRRVM